MLTDKEKQELSLFGQRGFNKSADVRFLSDILLKLNKAIENVNEKMIVDVEADGQKYVRQDGEWVLLEPEEN
jgi:hypothetical protein